MDYLHSECCTLWQSIAKVHSSCVQETLASSAAQHSTAQHSSAQHSSAQRSSAQDRAAQHSTAQHSTAQHSTAQHAFQLQCCSPILQLSYGALGVRADVVSQHHEAQQLHVGHMGLHLLLSHAQQVQLMHVWDDAHCHGHQPEAVAAKPISDLHSNNSNSNSNNNSDNDYDSDNDNRNNDTEPNNDNHDHADIKDDSNDTANYDKR